MFLFLEDVFFVIFMFVCDLSWFCIQEFFARGFFGFLRIQGRGGLVSVFSVFLGTLVKKLDLNIKSMYFVFGEGFSFRFEFCRGCMFGFERWRFMVVGSFFFLKRVVFYFFFQGGGSWLLEIKVCFFVGISGFYIWFCVDFGQVVRIFLERNRI